MFIELVVWIKRPGGGIVANPQADDLVDAEPLVLELPAPSSLGIETVALQEDADAEADADIRADVAGVTPGGPMSVETMRPAASTSVAGPVQSTVAARPSAPSDTGRPTRTASFPSV